MQRQCYNVDVNWIALTRFVFSFIASHIFETFMIQLLLQCLQLVADPTVKEKKIEKNVTKSTRRKSHVNMSRDKVAVVRDEDRIVMIITVTVNIFDQQIEFVH